MDSEEDVDELTGYHSVRQGPAPIVLHSTSKAEEAAVLAAHIKEWTQGEENVSIGVLTRTNQRGEEIARQLGEHDVAVSAGRRTSTERPVAVMTMHNAKGLEFTHVILLDVNAEALPQRYLFKGLAPAEADEALQRERALLYVAASRARDMLLVSVVGEASELLPAERISSVPLGLWASRRVSWSTQIARTYSKLSPPNSCAKAASMVG